MTVTRDVISLFESKRVVFVVSRGEDALPNGLDVTFEVTELRRMTGSYNTMVGNNEGSMVRSMMWCHHLFTDVDPVTVIPHGLNTLYIT